MSRQIIIENIQTLEALRECVSAEEWAEAEGFASLSRRGEWLSWRVSLRRVMGEGTRIEYNDIGAPRIAGSELHISVSHTKLHTAIVIDKKPCGIDIELTSRRFEDIESRYITPQERKIISPDNITLARAIIWCAKEAAYKYHSDPLIDMLKDITVQSIDLRTQTLVVNICGEEINAEFKIGENYVAVVV